MSDTVLVCHFLGQRRRLAKMKKHVAATGPDEALAA